MNKQKTNTEKAILEAAEALFLENGYHQASTTMIARKAGVTHAMLHYYYRTKEQIFLKTVEKNMNLMLHEMQSEMVTGHTFWEIIKGVTIKHFDFLKQHQKLPNLILEMTKDFPEVVEEYKNRIFATAEQELTLHNDRFNSEIGKGMMNRVNPLQLLFSAISLNMAPFLSIPFLQNVLGMDAGQIDLFLEERKEENLKLLYARLFGKEIPEII